MLRRRPPHPARLTGDGKIALSRTFVAPAFTADKKSHCDVKFVNLCRSDLQACQADTDMAWGDERIKKIVAVLAAEGIKISIAADIWYSYSYVCAYFLQHTF